MTMKRLRRQLLAVSGALAAGAAMPRPATAATPADAATKAAATRHIVLLGDSILDNGAYTRGSPDVIAQVRERLPGGWKATLLAVDGATTAGIPSQLAKLPADATDLVLSVGGNDALGRQDVLSRRSASVGEALRLLAGELRGFEADYRKAVAACLAPRLPLTVCTIYNGNFPDPAYQQAVSTAIALFDDVIQRTATERRLRLIELRHVCTAAADYANPIEPSSIGGAKIADAILRAVRGA